MRNKLFIFIELCIFIEEQLLVAITNISLSARSLIILKIVEDRLDFRRACQFGHLRTRGPLEVYENVYRKFEEVMDIIGVNVYRKFEEVVDIIGVNHNVTETSE